MMRMLISMKYANEPYYMCDRGMQFMSYNSRITLVLSFQRLDSVLQMFGLLDWRFALVVPAMQHNSVNYGSSKCGSEMVGIVHLVYSGF